MNRQAKMPSSVSPEFRLRPSLSVEAGGVLRDGVGVSPEFRLRPSLSEPEPDRHQHTDRECRRSSDSGLR